MSMETFLANLAGPAKRVTRNGREYAVAPVTLLIPGVLNGSRGPLYYPEDEVKSRPGLWNGIPLVAYHPVRNGQNVSANDPDVIAESGLGFVENDHFDSKLGKRRAEAWFDVEMTRNYDKKLRQQGKPEILPRVDRGEPIEVSTGLFTDNQIQSGTWNGKGYTAIARNYRSDHLAVLPDQRGACSITDGCGVHNQAALPEALPITNDWFRGFWEALTANDGEQSGPEQTKTCECGATECQSCGCSGSMMQTNAAVGQPKSQVTGKYKPNGSGVGKGPVHEAAQAGNLIVTDHDKLLGRAAAEEKQLTGRNPPSWAVDESKWEKAKAAADKGGYDGDSYWAVVSAIYQRMGGEIQGQVSNSAVELMATYNRNFTQEHRDRLPDEDFAGPGQSFPIVTQADVDAAEHLIGHAVDPEAVKHRIIEIAKRKGLSIPDAWKSPSTTNTEVEPMNKGQLVTWLTTNCDCWKGADKVLNTMDEEQLKKLHANATVAQQNQLAVNSFTEAFKDVAGKDLTVNDMTPAQMKAMASQAKKPAPAGPGDNPEPDEDDQVTQEPGNAAPAYPPQQKQPTGNSKKGSPTMKFEDLLAAAPPEYRAAFDTAQQITNQLKTQLIGQLTANAGNDEVRKVAATAYSKLGIPELQAMVAAMPRQPVANQQVAAATPAPTLFFPGGFANPSDSRQPVTNEDRDDILDLPVINQTDWEAQAGNLKRLPQTQPAAA